MYFFFFILGRCVCKRERAALGRYWNKATRTNVCGTNSECATEGERQRGGGEEGRARKWCSEREPADSYLRILHRTFCVFFCVECGLIIQCSRKHWKSSLEINCVVRCRDCISSQILKVRIKKKKSNTPYPHAYMTTPVCRRRRRRCCCFFGYGTYGTRAQAPLAHTHTHTRPCGTCPNIVIIIIYSFYFIFFFLSLFALVKIERTSLRITITHTHTRTSAH